MGRIDPDWEIRQLEDELTESLEALKSDTSPELDNKILSLAKKFAPVMDLSLENPPSSKKWECHLHLF